ncbi:MAG TPA: polysaccharide deacetylase [Gammaproteobacteria bacterium]|uniref:Polysaccharide deacetylase n=1 Tax=OM182 bacterium TaxID=2510334 RepID=A0A520RX21_9GAMM|nr:MAG: polysaccharide deacetylase [OM182 bacterium]HAO89701.1 polysaccharide deacetylase [Gammaproteobacteria bacterium]HAR91177.1 polysaccharide deacetylase [Gammaproteobacteria bacterium]HAU24961.1 polysaccharide deacetylase [Gammaproteobacteria bacterium]
MLTLLLALLYTSGTWAQPAINPAEPWNWPDDYVVEQVNQVRAGRDLTPSSWPNGARVAVLLSYDVDNETVMGLRTGDISVGPLSQGQYGSRVALPRVVELMNEQDIPATYFLPAWSLKLAPEQAQLINASGLHEIAVHGWIHELNTALDGATEERLLRQAMDEIERIAGVRPVGFRAPSWNLSANTLRIVRDLGLLYESSLMHDDRPYEVLYQGEPTGIVELPVEWILDDAPLFNPLGQRYMNPRDVMQVWIDEFDRAWEEGTMFLLTMHPHVIGHRSRLVALEGLIEHIKSKDGVWFATHEQAARYVKAQAGMP